MFNKSQFAVAALFASTVLAIPVTLNLDVESRSAVAEPGYVELHGAPPPYLDVRDEASSYLQARSEVYNDFVATPATNQDRAILEARHTEKTVHTDKLVHTGNTGRTTNTGNNPNTDLSVKTGHSGDPYGGKYSNSEKTRQKELKNIANGLSPTGGDKEDYLRKANGGTLPDKYGEGFENSVYSKASFVCYDLFRLRCS